MDKLNIEEVSMERRKEIHDAIKAVVYEQFGDMTEFVIVLPEYNIMATNMHPKKCAYNMSGAVTSILNADYRLMDENQPDTGGWQ